MEDAKLAQLASWDGDRREWYLAVPVSIQRRKVPIAPDVDGRIVTLTPADFSGAPLTYAPGTSVGRWVCGAAAHGTTVAPKYLPGSCRGA